MEDDPIVKLNVGGHRVETKSSTLKAASWFSDNKLEEIFIDEDWSKFRHVINFLRNPLFYKFPPELKDLLDKYGVSYES